MYRVARRRFVSKCRVITEHRQAEQRYLDGVEQLDDGDGDRVMEHAAQTDTGERHGGAERRITTPIFFMMIGTTPIMADSRNTWKEFRVP